MLKIALTGGIACGKSTVAKYFSKLKIEIIDADEINHELFARGGKVYKKIITHFGECFLTRKKNINRKKLREFIFNNKAERLWLEKLVHPLICAEMNRRAKKAKSPYCILVIPLLFETKFSPKIDRILTIECPRKTQIERITARDKNPENLIKKIIATQTPSSIRKKRADDVIYNTGSLQKIKTSVKSLHQLYLNLSHKTH